MFFWVTVVTMEKRSAMEPEHVKGTLQVPQVPVKVGAHA
jgi:hypothetical protein